MLDHARLRGRGGVLLMRPARGIGPARLLVVSPGGNVRQVELSRVRAGTGKPVGAAPPGTTRELSPALAVDRTGRHAYVVGTGRVVAAVDLATLSTTYHQVPGLKSHLLMGRVRMTGTVEQQQGHTRRATWLSGGTLLVSGITEVPASDGRARWGRTPDRLVSTTTWRIVRELPRHVWPASRTTLLRQPRDDKGHVTVYRADGSAALTLPGAWATVAGARLFAGTIGVSHVHEYDVATGRNLGPVDGAWFTGTELRPLIAWRPPTIGR
jgi:hypothetical protein